MTAVTYDFIQPVTPDITLTAVYIMNEGGKIDKSTPSKNQVEQKKEVTDKSNILPNTGEKSPFIVIISGILLITIASLWVAIRRRKNSR